MTADLATPLRAALQPSERLAILGIGSRLRGDDAAGMLAADHVQRLGQAEITAGRLAVFLGETAPENLTGPIKSYQPTHLLAIDAADLGLPPGSVRLIDPAAADGGAGSTHNLPLGVLVDYIRRQVGCRILIIAIQPASTAFGQPPAPAVRSAARRVAKDILLALGGNY